MDWSELIFSSGVVGAIVSWIGAIVSFFSILYIEKQKKAIRQEIESYKTKLKKSEFLFQEEIEAASQFVSLRRSILPTYRYPGMLWDEACEDFASDFADVEKKLERYLAAHGAVLTQPVFDRLSDAIQITSEGRFEIYHYGEVSSDGRKRAEKVMDELKALENELRAGIRSQLST